MPFWMLLNFIVKGWYLGQSSIQGDEPFSVYHAQMDIFSIDRLLSQGNNPPLFEILLHFWIQVFGISEITVRMPSLIFSTIAVGFLYQIGNQFFNRRVAVLVSLFFVFSNFQISLSHEARVYQLLCMLTAWSMWLFMGVLQLTQRASNNSEDFLRSALRNKFIGLVFVNSLIIYSHYFGFFVLFVQFFFLIFHRPIFKKVQYLYWLSIAATAFIYVPNVLTVFQRFSASSKGTWISKPSGIEDAYNMIRTFSNAPLNAVLVIVVFVLFGLKRASKQFEKAAETQLYQRFVAFWFLFVFGFMFLVSFWIPMFYNRYLMVAATGFVLFVAVAADFAFSHHKKHYLLPILLSGCWIFTANLKDSNKVNVQQMVADLKKNQTEKTIVYFAPDWFDINFTLYYHFPTFQRYDKSDIKKNMHSFLRSSHVYPIKNQNDLNSHAIANAEKVIFLDAQSDYHYPGNSIKRALDSMLQQTKEIDYSEGYKLYIYRPKKSVNE